MKLGPQFQRDCTLPDGTKVRLRMIRPDDRSELRRGFLSLSPESRYRRFFAALSDLSDDVLTYLTEVDGTNHVAIVATVESPDLKFERGIGVARFVRTPDKPEVAEAAVTVLDDMQRRGVGSLLATALLDAARERGVTRFRGEVLSSNAPMLDALREAGATLDDTGVGTVAFEVPIGSKEGEPILFRLFRLFAASMAILLREMRPSSAPPR